MLFHSRVFTIWKIWNFQRIFFFTYENLMNEEISMEFYRYSEKFLEFYF